MGDIGDDDERDAEERREKWKMGNEWIEGGQNDHDY